MKAVDAQVSLSPPAPDKPTRDGEVEGALARQVGANSETTYI